MQIAFFVLKIVKQLIVHCNLTHPIQALAAQLELFYINLDDFENLPLLAVVVIDSSKCICNLPAFFDILLANTTL